MHSAPVALYQLERQSWHSFHKPCHAVPGAQASHDDAAKDDTNPFGQGKHEDIPVAFANVQGKQRVHDDPAVGE